jgi:heme oxygenase
VRPLDVNPRALSSLLRSRTKDAHLAAERSGVMAALLRGHISRETYALLLRNLHPLYDALERGLDSAQADPWIAPIYDVRLWRTAPLERDLVYLAGPAWAALPIAPTAAAYARRLEALLREHPGRLAAHAYVRYLGDLFGGQIIARVVRKTLALPEGQGTAFYEFAAIDDLSAMSGRWRAALDEIPAPDTAKEQLADEALLGFEMHIQLFTELAALAA